MKEIKETCYKGTRILVGNHKRNVINRMVRTLIIHDFTEIQIPNIQFKDTFANKVGDNNKMMFDVKDKTDRELCLAPEYTAVIQQLAKTTYKHQKDVRLFYVQECYRGEKPQAGRYRQFTQLGVEILNPTKEYELPYLALSLMSQYNVVLNTDVSRGLEYYKNGKGFEITCDELGSSKQVCGGGEYDGGVGFAIGIDRLLSLDKK